MTHTLGTPWRQNRTVKTPYMSSGSHALTTILTPGPLALALLHFYIRLSSAGLLAYLYIFWKIGEGFPTVNPASPKKDFISGLLAEEGFPWGWELMLVARMHRCMVAL